MKSRGLTVLLLYCLLLPSLFTACHKNIRQRAAEEAREYTRKYCPTPVYNNTRTDSTVFNIETDEYIYYCTLTGTVDNQDFVNQHHDELRLSIAQAIRNEVKLLKYKQAGFAFRYICRSAQSPEKILFDETFTKEDYR